MSWAYLIAIPLLLGGVAAGIVWLGWGVVENVIAVLTRNRVSRHGTP